MTARRPLILIDEIISELPVGDSIIGEISATQIRQYVKNGENFTIYKGQAVYVSGASGANVLVKLAKANSELTSSKTLGLLEQDLAKNAQGYVVNDGLLSGLNTNAATQEGDPVWLSPTVAGGLIYGYTDKPHAPAHLVYLGVVTRKQINNGSISVKVQNGYELEELHNVAITTPQDDDIISYDATTNLWKNIPKPSDIRIFNLIGTLVPMLGTVKFFPDKTIVITEAYLSIGVNSQEEVTVNVNKNGIMVGSISLPPDTEKSDKQPLPLTVTENDYLTVDLLTTGGKNLNLIMVYS
jgi:hypothetical protein